MKARFVGLGGIAIAGSPADFGKLIAHETEKWGSRQVLSYRVPPYPPGKILMRPVSAQKSRPIAPVFLMRPVSAQKSRPIAPVFRAQARGCANVSACISRSAALNDVC
jgi:hypothetical protein